MSRLCMQEAEKVTARGRCKKGIRKRFRLLLVGLDKEQIKEKKFSSQFPVQNNMCIKKRSMSHIPAAETWFAHPAIHLQLQGATKPTFQINPSLLLMYKRTGLGGKPFLNQYPKQSAVSTCCRCLPIYTCSCMFLSAHSV